MSCILIGQTTTLGSFFFSPLWRYGPTRAMAFSFLRFLDHTHNDAPQSVGLLWKSDQLVAETLPDNTQHSQQTDIHAPGGIRTHDLSKLVAADLRLRPRGHWDRITKIIPLPILGLNPPTSSRYWEAHSRLLSTTFLPSTPATVTTGRCRTVWWARSLLLKLCTTELLNSACEFKGLRKVHLSYNESGQYNFDNT